MCVYIYCIIYTDLIKKPVLSINGSAQDWPALRFKRSDSESNLTLLHGRMHIFIVCGERV